MQESGWTPLMFVVKDNRIPLGDRMIDLGCDVNHRNKVCRPLIQQNITNSRDQSHLASAT